MVNTLAAVKEEEIKDEPVEIKEEELDESEIKVEDDGEIKVEDDGAPKPKRQKILNVEIKGMLMYAFDLVQQKTKYIFKVNLCDIGVIFDHAFKEFVVQCT